MDNDIQITIETLISIHEDEKELKKMSEVLHHMSPTKCQGAIAEVVRYLMVKRDEGE
jgi:hypothetical protein